MKPIHLLAALFGALTLVIDLMIVREFAHRFEIALMLFLGVASGQLALLTCWCVQGAGSWAVRFAVTLAAAVGLSQPLGTATGGSWTQWWTLWCLFCGATGGAMLLLRLCGISLGMADRRPADDQPAGDRRWSQFSLSGLMAVMTASALLLGLHRHVEFPAHDAGAMIGYSCGLTVVALATLAVMRWRVAVLLPLIGLGALCLLVGLVMAHVGPPSHVWFFTCVAWLEAFVICAGLAVVQLGVATPLPANAPDEPVENDGRRSWRIVREDGEVGTAV